jgi:hypothetical protein
MAGARPLAEAYDKARIVKGARESVDGQLGRLRTVAPDLADRVAGGMDLGEAEGAVIARQKQEQEGRQWSADVIERTGRRFRAETAGHDPRM